MIIRRIPDEIHVLSGFTVEIRVEGRDREAGNHLVLEKQLLGLVVKWPWRRRTH
jgi:hypothetical protein